MSEQSASLTRLNKLIGNWHLEIKLPGEPTSHHGRASFEWLPGKAFVMYRTEIEDPRFPVTEAIIGSDDTLDSYSMVYSDSRGVQRVYLMSLDDREWQLWRDAPDFAQRFSGTFSEDGNTLTARWEKSLTAKNWEHDFDVICTRTTD